MRESATENTRANLARPCVLIVGHADGWIEIFGQGIDARFVNIPTMSSSAGEIMAEDYVSSEIPQRYRDIYYPGNRICVGQLRPFIAQDIVAYRDYRQAWQAVDAIQNDSQERKAS